MQKIAIVCLLLSFAACSVLAQKTLDPTNKIDVKQKHQLFGLGVIELTFGYYATMHLFGDDEYAVNRGYALRVASPFGGGLGVYGKYGLGKKLSLGLFTDVTIGLGKLGTESVVAPTVSNSATTVDLNLTPQLEYKPIKQLGIYLGAKNKINLDEFRENADGKTVSYRDLPGKIQLFSAYELHGQAGIRGYFKKGFVDVSYLHGLTPPTDIVFTDDTGNSINATMKGSQGVKLTFGGVF